MPPPCHRLLSIASPWLRGNAEEYRFHFGGSHPLATEERVPVGIERGARSRAAKSAMRDSDAPVLAHEERTGSTPKVVASNRPETKPLQARIEETLHIARLERGAGLRRSGVSHNAKPVF